MNEIIWTEEDMVDAACEWWGEGFSPADCDVIPMPAHDGECLVVRHLPTGRTSDEAGNGGRWNLDHTAR
jgi:hypothetical protein